MYTCMYMYLIYFLTTFQSNEGHSKTANIYRPPSSFTDFMLFATKYFTNYQNFAKETDLNFSLFYVTQ